MKKRKEVQKRRPNAPKKTGPRVVAGTLFGLACGTGLPAQQIMPPNPQDLPNPHHLPVSQDRDGDYLSDREEYAVGFFPFVSDKNQNEVVDGVELARRCHSIIMNLPTQEDAHPGQVYTVYANMFGLETCGICGDTLNMGWLDIVNPRVKAQIQLPILSLHYLEHGSFSYVGTLHEGRVDIPRLLHVLQVHSLHRPNDHQLALDAVIKPFGQLAPDANDFDQDLLADKEELGSLLNLRDADQDDNFIPDGIDLAQQCVRAIDELEILEPDAPNATRPYRVSYMQRGLEFCPVCGEAVNMGFWRIVNPAQDKTMDVHDITLHYMRHGSFSFFGQGSDETILHAGRQDVAGLRAILEMPRQCGDLGTLYAPRDINRDCQVDIRDLDTFLKGWLKSAGPHDSDISRPDGLRPEN